ncbi:hypothetical protein [Hyphomonas beringensis]
MTFPASVELSFIGAGASGQTLDVRGSDVGDRWYARKEIEPLFPFAFGLSYTDFDLSGLKVRKQGAAINASFGMKNTGAYLGADVAQLYLVSVDGETKQRLVGFAKRELDPDEMQDVACRLIHVCWLHGKMTAGRFRRVGTNSLWVRMPTAWALP